MLINNEGFWQCIEALKITINKLYNNRCIFSAERSSVNPNILF